MPQATAFFTTMAALCAATHTLVEHLVKRIPHFLPKKGSSNWTDEGRYAWIHVASFVVGSGLAWLLDLTPLTQLGLQRSPVVNALAAGVLVSFGGGFFNDVLGALQEFKQAQQVKAKASP
jgi:predicted Co/Zn/Cd cation transporter (cation efflux family)